MKEKTTAIISFIGSIGYIIFCLFVLINEHIDNDNMFAFFSLLTTATSTALYVTWTKFGKTGNPDLEKLDTENRLLQKQIEQKELKKKLEENN